MTRTTILKMAPYIFMTGMIMTGCDTPVKKMEKAKEDVIVAQQELDRANQAYLEDVENYRKETTEKIAKNDSIIKAFKKNTEHRKQQYRTGYMKEIAKLEQKNNDLKKRMNDYKAEGKENWKSFKTEFNHDMDELGKAFKDLTVDNVK